MPTKKALSALPEPEPDAVLPELEVKPPRTVRKKHVHREEWQTVEPVVDQPPAQIEIDDDRDDADDADELDQLELDPLQQVLESLGELENLELRVIRKPDPPHLRGMFARPCPVEVQCGTIHISDFNNAVSALQAAFGGGFYRVQVIHNSRYAGQRTLVVSDPSAQSPIPAHYSPPNLQPATMQPGTPVDPLKALKEQIRFAKEVKEMFAEPAAASPVSQLSDNDRLTLAVTKDSSLISSVTTSVVTAAAAAAAGAASAAAAVNQPAADDFKTLLIQDVVKPNLPFALSLLGRVVTHFAPVKLAPDLVATAPQLQPVEHTMPAASTAAPPVGVDPVEGIFLQFLEELKGNRQVTKKTPLVAQLLETQPELFAHVVKQIADNPVFLIMAHVSSRFPEYAPHVAASHAEKWFKSLQKVCQQLNAELEQK